MADKDVTPFLTPPSTESQERPAPKPRAPWLSPPSAPPPADGAEPTLEDIFDVDDLDGAPGEQPQDVPEAPEVETEPVDTEPAKPAVADTAPVRPIADAGQFRRQLEMREALRPSVERLLSFISSNPKLSTLSGRLVLTRDHKLDAEQQRMLSEALRPELLSMRVDVTSPEQIDQLLGVVYDEVIGISVLGDLWRDDTVDEICVDAWDRVSVERNGKLELTGYRFRSPEHAASIARHLSQKISDRPLSNANPLVTAQLPQARVQFVYGPLTASGLSITIRKFRALMGMDALLGVGALNTEMRDFLADAVRARATIVVSGGTGTGKTTAVNALSEFIPDTERVITIEDSYELQLANTHVVSLQSKVQSSSDDTIVISLADLLVASLRMRPDRIIVGEVREPHAASVMFDAANTGHDGALTTIHADTPASALNARLATLLVRSPDSGFSERTARLSIAQAVQVVVHIARRHGRRYISEISLVDPMFLADDAGALIVPQTIFQAHVRRDGEHVTIEHRRVGSVGTDTQLAMRFSDLSDSDPSRWLS